MHYYVEPLALCLTTCASYVTCHLTKHTPLVLFLTRDFLSLFHSGVLSSIHLCDMTSQLNKVDGTSPNLVVCHGTVVHGNLKKEMVFYARAAKQK